MKGRYLISIGAGALSVGIAQAQTAPSGVAGAPVEQSGRTRPDTSELEEIIVTATKVETSLQKTPLAITSVSGETLTRAGAVNPQELNKLVPGLQIEQNSSQSSIFIRGIGSRALSSSSDPAVAFSVDGVYYARTTGQAAALFDLARIEVVKGPQGTLYGRNATGGAVNVITNRPLLDSRTMDFALETGNYATVRASAAVNLPVGDTVAIRVAGRTSTHSGYLSDGYSDEDIKAGRISLLYAPSGDFSLYVSGDYAHQGGQGSGTVPVGPGAFNGALTTRFVVPGQPYTGPSDPRISAFLHAAVPPSALPIPGPGTKCVGVPFAGAAAVAGAPALITCTYPFGSTNIQPNGYLDNRFYGANATARGNLGFADLTAIGGYRASRVNALTYPDWKSQQQNVASDEYTAELRLNSRPSSGALTWIFGAFYLKEKINSVFNISSGEQALSNPVPSPASPLPGTTCIGPLGPPPGTPGVCLANASVIKHNFVTSDPDITNETYAGFGQATLSLTHWLRLTGGARYTHESKSEVGGRLIAYYTLPAGVTDSFPTQGSVAFHNVSYRAGIEIDVAPRSLFYATYSTGFHAGGFNAGVPQGPNVYAYQPEEVRSYVVGMKNRFFDNRVQLNIEGFWLDYTNYQTASLGRVNDGTTACSVLLIATSCALNLRTDNAAAARARGVEVDGLLRVGRNGTLSLNALYNQARFRKFVIPAFPVGTVDYSGRRLPGAPDWTITGSYIQNFPLAHGGLISAEVRSQYRSDAQMFYDYAPGNFQKGYTRTDLSLGYTLPGGHVSITAFLRNVENKATLLNGVPTEGSTNVPFVSLNPPRTFGGILSAHF